MGGVDPGYHADPDGREQCEEVGVDHRCPEVPASRSRKKVGREGNRGAEDARDRADE